MHFFKRTLLIIAMAMSLTGCFVGETAGLVVQAPFEVADVVLPGAAGDAVEETGEGLGWIVDAVIPF